MELNQLIMLGACSMLSEDCPTPGTDEYREGIRRAVTKAKKVWDETLHQDWIERNRCSK